MKQIDCNFCIITAQRTVNTIDKSIASLRAAGITETLFIFAEPDAKIPEDEKIIVIQNAEKRGCFKNFANTLESIWFNRPFTVVLSDDFIYHKNLIEYLEPVNDSGTFLMYTDAALFNKFNEKPQWKAINEGWNTHGGLFIMAKGTIKKMIDSESYKNHRDSYAKNMQIDSFVGKWHKENGIPTFYHNPSLTEHFGKDNSTLGHEHTNYGLGWGK